MVAMLMEHSDKLVLGKPSRFLDFDDDDDFGQHEIIFMCCPFGPLILPTVSLTRRSLPIGEE